MKWFMRPSMIYDGVIGMGWLLASFQKYLDMPYALYDCSSDTLVQFGQTIRI